MRYLLLFLVIFITSCSTFNKKEETRLDEFGKPIKKKKINPNVSQRAEEAAEGFRIGGKQDVDYNFANANVIWRASLEVLDDIPLTTANYAGGIISTDWYGDENSNQSIKIQITFFDNEVKVSSFDVKGFKKTCSANNSCKVTKTTKKFNKEIKSNILDKTRELSLEKAQKKK